jgi:hypothetical protein
MDAEAFSRDLMARWQRVPFVMYSMLPWATGHREFCSTENVYMSIRPMMSSVVDDVMSHVMITKALTPPGASHSSFVILQTTTVHTCCNGGEEHANAKAHLPAFNSTRF